MKSVFGEQYTEENDKILAHKAGNPEESVQSAGEVRRSAPEGSTSRRRMLGLSGALGATVAGLGLLDATPAAAASTKVDAGKVLGRGRTIVDMSHTWGSDFPGFTPFVAPATFDHVATLEEEGYNTYMITMDEHSGTHMDCPKHFDNGAWSSDEIPGENLIAPLVVIRIAERAQKDPDTLVTYRDLVKWESRHGRIPDGALVAMDCGWSDRINDPERIYNRDAEDIPHFPGFGWDAAEFLQSRRNIVGISVDSPSMDSGENNFKGAYTHKILLPNNIYGMEWTANTGLLPESGAVAVVGLMKHRGGFAGPVRMFGIY